MRGKVIRKRVAQGSKSDREAVLLLTEEGQYVLKIVGGNPFMDLALEQLVGKELECEGQQHGQSFLMSDWVEIDS